MFIFHNNVTNTFVGATSYGKKILYGADGAMINIWYFKLELGGVGDILS